jgi:hypothetical protein
VFTGYLVEVCRFCSSRLVVELRSRLPLPPRKKKIKRPDPLWKTDERGGFYSACPVCQATSGILCYQEYSKNVLELLLSSVYSSYCWLEIDLVARMETRGYPFLGNRNLEYGAHGDGDRLH